MIKWKTVETITPDFPDGAIFIKEDTSIEFPLAIVAFPLGGHANGTKKQRERAKLIAAAPELLKACQEALKYVCVEEPAYDVLCNAIKRLLNNPQTKSERNRMLYIAEVVAIIEEAKNVENIHTHS